MSIFKPFRTTVGHPNKQVLRTEELDDEILQAILDSKVPDKITYMDEEEESGH